MTWYRNHSTQKIFIIYCIITICQLVTLTSGVPWIAAVSPWQFLLKTGEQVIDRPSYDDIIIDANYWGNSHHSHSNTCRQKWHSKRIIIVYYITVYYILSLYIIVCHIISYYLVNCYHGNTNQPREGRIDKLSPVRNSNIAPGITPERKLAYQWRLTW